MSGTTTLFGSEDEELDNPGRRPPPYVLPVAMVSSPVTVPSVTSLYLEVLTLQSSPGLGARECLSVCNLFKALMLPEQLIIIKCTVHIGAGDSIAKGNEFDDRVSKQCSLYILMHSDSS